MCKDFFSNESLDIYYLIKIRSDCPSISFILTQKEKNIIEDLQIQLEQWQEKLNLCKWW